MSEELFKIEVPLDAFEKANASDVTSRRIGGICTTNDLDRQAEVVLQDGLDFGPFLDHGFFNDNHNPATDAAVGYPTRAFKKDLGMGRRGWYVEGYLLKGYEPAEKLWGLAKSLEGTPRQLGFSIEGSILERDRDNPKIIRKAVVREVAITRCPVNPSTSLMTLAKSLSMGVGLPPKGTPITGDGAAALLVPESLEGIKPEARGGKRRKKKMSKSEAVAFLMSRNAKLNKAQAEIIVEHAMKWHSAA